MGEKYKDLLIEGKTKRIYQDHQLFRQAFFLIEGKTKRIYQDSDDSDFVIVESKDDLTAGDGAQHDVIEGKAAWSTETTCNVFELLDACLVPLAYSERLDDTAFRARKCEMIPLEVVVRRELHGSAIKRQPHLPTGLLLNQLKVEFFLKTPNKKWRGRPIRFDDPMIRFKLSGDLELYNPKAPLHSRKPFKKLAYKSLPKILKKALEASMLKRISTMAQRIFLVLEKAWSLQNHKLVDFKIEFGFDTSGDLLLADVIDSDSWRLIFEGEHQDKEIYRQGGKSKLEELAIKYSHVAELSKRLVLPRQQLIFWRASDKDDMGEFENALGEYGVNLYIRAAYLTGSLHKRPVESCQEIAQQVQDVPDAVLIVYCGRSNGAGPTLSAQVTIPTITVPAGWSKCPEDVWSSLRTPSDVPVSVILEPKNAVLHALQILAARHPAIYAELRIRQETRLDNFFSI
ncbi:MAG: AIR carboxylase family protein [Candidatus Nomurabacteria bacterium]|nr:AIR carboxylase family protein [Candidatus Nomurabacteria bacterium]